jgi:hypothetical protein
VRADAFVELRRQALGRLKTHHMSTNHLVTRETDNTFDTLAHYTHTLVRTPQGWKITRVQQSVAWDRGNPAIHAGARPAADSPPRTGG